MGSRKPEGLTNIYFTALNGTEPRTPACPRHSPNNRPSLNTVPVFESQKQTSSTSLSHRSSKHCASKVTLVRPTQSRSNQCCILDGYCCCVVDRHCFFFPAVLRYVLYVSHKLIQRLPFNGIEIIRKTKKIIFYKIGTCRSSEITFR